MYPAGKVTASRHLTPQKIPKDVICLLSALSFHQIGAQLPHEVWIAIDVKAWTPRNTSPAFRIMRFSGNALHFGIQERAGDAMNLDFVAMWW